MKRSKSALTMANITSTDLATTPTLGSGRPSAPTVSGSNCPPPTLPKTFKRRPEISMAHVCGSMKNNLPMKMMVTHGTYGVTPESTFSEDEFLTAHFIQTLDSVVFNPFEHGRYRPLYKIPLNSSVTASVVYNPRNKLKEAMNGYVFPSPLHLMNSNPQKIPKLVTVMKEHFEKGNPQYSVELNDVLYIAEQSKIGRKRVLKCTHVTSGLTKYMKEDCNVKLSTRPEHVSLPLSRILQYMDLPIEVLVTIPPATPGAGGTEIAGVITGRITSQYAICSRVFGPEQENKLFAIPENFEVDMRQLQCSERDMEDLCATSAKYFKEFVPSEVSYEIPCLTDCLPYDRNPSTVQLSLYKAILPEKASNGLNCPEKLRRFFPMKNFQTRKPSSQGASLENRVQLLEETIQTLFTEVKLLKEQLERKSKQHQHDDDSKRNKYEEMAEAAFDIAIGLRKTTMELQKQSESMSGRMEALNETMTEMELRHAGLDDDGYTDMFKSDYQPLIPPKTWRRSHCQRSSSFNDSGGDKQRGSSFSSDGNSSKQPGPFNSFSGNKQLSSSALNDPQTISSLNRQYLMSLTIQEVTELLVKLNLRHHVAMFINENITGERLAGLNKRDMIRLNVTDESEIEKLISLITGQESALPLIML